MNSFTKVHRKLPFILRSQIQTFSCSTGRTAIKALTVVGSGLMGSGIAQVAAQNGTSVTLVDVNKKILEKSQHAIHASVQRVAKKLFKDDPEKAEQYVSRTLSNLNFSTDVVDAAAQSDLVIEAIVENLKIKQELFGKIDQTSPENTIFASNTSSLPIGDIASVTSRRDRFVGLHFFNPVPVMKLLEVIRLPETTEDTFNKVMTWGKEIGKQTVVCKDTPGFIVNRLLVPYMMEAVRLLERGDATSQDIDVAMKLGAGYPMGPFELLDYVGLDTSKFIIEGWAKKFPDNPLFKPVSTLNELVAQGKLGIKTGEGFYKYQKK